MHRGLALAHGGRLQTPRLDYALGRSLEITFFEGAGFVREYPVQDHLNQGPFIEALVTRYEQHKTLPEILWTALGWMQIDTTFNEVRFLSGMTAIEAIINRCMKRRRRVIARSDFAPLRNKLVAVIEAEETLAPGAKELFTKVITQQMNRTVLQKNIRQLFSEYKISRTDFEDEEIERLVRLRDEIVHTGEIPDGIDIWPSIILLRELITRILLKEIGFVGRYCCYVGGRHYRDFPNDGSPETA